MISKYHIAILLFVLLSSVTSAEAEQISYPKIVNKWAKGVLKEYRLPEKQDLKGHWLECAKAGKHPPYWTSGDYNGDGVEDCAFILINKKKSNYAVFALVSKKGKFKLHNVHVFKDSLYQDYGIGCVKPGIYQTANGKGYGIHDPNAPDSVKIINESILWYLCESSSSFYYWDFKSESFKKVWISD